MAKESNFPSDGLLQFSKIVGKALADSGLRQLDFAKQVNVSQGSVSHWTSNMKAKEGDRLSAPSASNILVLAQFIYNPQTSKPFTPSELFAICSGENSLTPAQLEEIKFLGGAVIR